MTAPQAAPSPERLPGEERAGSITLTAKVASGRRSTVLLGHRDGQAAPIVVRRPTSNPARFLADCDEAGGLAVGVPSEAEPDGSIAMPAVVGESLATLLADLAVTGEPMPIHLALTIAIGITDELMKLDKNNPHGDLVPHHVLIGYDGHVTLIDPAASAYQDRAQAPGREGYRSPEHVNGDPLTSASDVFVLGILLFEMTTGQALYGEATHAANDARISEGNMPRPRDIVGDGFPIELQLVLRKLLRPTPSGRFADARAAKDALRLAATSRSDVGPEALSAWLFARFPARRAAWDDVLEASRARTVPVVAARPAEAEAESASSEDDDAEAPSRAPTTLTAMPPRPFSLSGIASESTVPTRAIPRAQTDPLEESPLEVDTFQDLGGATSGSLTMEQIERADAEERSLFTFPTTRPGVDLDDEPDLDDAPADATGPLRAQKKRGAGRAIAPGLIPDLPTEVSSRRAQQVEALRAERDASSEPTALDEIEESDLLSGSLDAIRLEPLPSLALDDDDPSARGPAWQPPWELEVADAEETSPPEGLVGFGFDDEPPPSTGPSPAPVGFELDDEPAPSTGPSPAPLSAVDFLDDDADLSSPDLSDAEAFAPLDADFLDALGDDAPMSLASVDFLDALPPKDEEPDAALELGPNTDRHPAEADFSALLEDDAPDTFPPDHGRPGARITPTGLPAARAPSSGLPAPSNAPARAGLPAAKSAARPPERPDDAVVPHGFTDAAPTPHALDEELSSDLVLDGPLGDSPDLTSDLWDDDPDEPNDTIDESAASDILTPDELALMQRAAEIVPKREDTAPLGLPPLAAPFRAATDPGPDTRLVGPTAPLRGATDPSGPPAAMASSASGRPSRSDESERPTAIGGSASLPEHKPRPKPNLAEHSVRPVAPLMPPSPNDRPNQRGIATQVVRDRITDQHGAAIPSTDFVTEGQVPTQVVRERSVSRPPAPAPATERRPPVDRTRTPVGPAGPTFVDPMGQEDSLNGELVIPLSDDEIKRSERRKRVLIGVLVIAPVTLLALGFLAFSQFSETPATVSIPSQGAAANGRPIPPPPVDEAIDDPPPGDPDEAVEVPPPPRANVAPPPPPPAKAPPPPPPVTPPPVSAPPVSAPPVTPPAPTGVDPAPPPPVEPPTTVETPPPPAATPTKVVVRILPEHAKFEYDGVEYDNGAELESGAEPLEILVYAEGYVSQRQTVAPYQKSGLTVLLKAEQRVEPDPPPDEPDEDPELDEAPDPELDDEETIEP